MEVCHIVLGCGAALDEVEACALVNDYKGMLELTCALCIQSEIGLEGDRKLNALGHIHK